MNKIYRLVRQRHTGTLIPVAEFSRAGGKSAQNRKVGVTPCLLLAMAGMVGSVANVGAAEIVIDGGTEETVPGTKPDGWKTGIRVDLVIGDTGSGKLTVSDGAKATTVGASYLGREAGAVGSALITGIDSRWKLYNYDPLYGQDSESGGGWRG